MEIVDVSVLFIVDVFDPIVVDRVDSELCVISNLCPKVVDTLEIDNCRIDKLEPVLVDRFLTLRFSSGNIPLFAAAILLLIITRWSPIDVENVDTDAKRPDELILENTDPHITEILDAFVEVATLSSVNDGDNCVDRFESVVDVLEETFDASEEIPSFRLASTPST